MFIIDAMISSLKAGVETAMLLHAVIVFFYLNRSIKINRCGYFSHLRLLHRIKFHYDLSNEAKSLVVENPNCNIILNLLICIMQIVWIGYSVKLHVTLILFTLIQINTILICNTINILLTFKTRRNFLYFN